MAFDDRFEFCVSCRSGLINGIAFFAVSDKFRFFYNAVVGDFFGQFVERLVCPVPENPAVCSRYNLIEKLPLVQFHDLNAALIKSLNSAVRDGDRLAAYGVCTFGVDILDKPSRRIVALAH